LGFFRFGVRVSGSGFGFAISGSGFRVWRFGFQVFWVSGFRVFRVSGFRVSGFGFQIGFGFEVQVWGFGFGVRGSRFGVSDVGLVLRFEFRV
jgi:hypothetical protein